MTSTSTLLPRTAYIIKVKLHYCPACTRTAGVEQKLYCLFYCPYANKIVFKKTCYVSNNLCCHFQQFPWEIGSVRAERVGQGEVGWYIHPKGENNMAVCGFGWKISLSRVIVQMVLENSHFTSQGLHACSVQVRFISLSNLISNVLRMTECNRTCSLEQENPYVCIGFGYQLNVYSICTEHA